MHCSDVTAKIQALFLDSEMFTIQHYKILYNVNIVFILHYLKYIIL